MGEFQVWQSVKDAYWYWHLLDEYGDIRCGSWQKHATSSDCVTEINKVSSLVGGSYRVPINFVPDPNA